MKKKQQKGNLNALIIAALVVLGVVAFVAMHNARPSYLPQEEAQQQTTIENDTDLQKVSDDLDTTNVDSMDAELNQNDADVAAL